MCRRQFHVPSSALTHRARVLSRIPLTAGMAPVGLGLSGFFGKLRSDIDLPSETWRSAKAVTPAESHFLVFHVLEDLFETGASLEEELDPQLWSLLPVEFLEQVQLVLPSRSQARFRAVSKA